MEGRQSYRQRTVATNRVYIMNNVLLWLSTLLVLTNTEMTVKKPEDVLDRGDPSWCFLKLSPLKLHRFEVLPGSGWDNLENKERGLVFEHKYHSCQTTNDGRFLIPDSIQTTPVKSSKMDVFSEIFDSWLDYKDTTSSSINVNAGFHYGPFGIDGKFSHESQNVKENQVREQTNVLRTQARYVEYSATTQPDSKLHPSFRKRLLSIASHLMADETEMAKYESELLVRDFGTHVTTHIDAGAVLAQIQHVRSSFLSKHNYRSMTIEASLSASFSDGIMGGYVGVSSKHSASKEMKQAFYDNVTSATTKSYGGPSYLPENFTLQEWAEKIDDNLVAVDRAGTPLYDLITQNILPELPASIIPDLFNNVKDAIYTYYKYNTHKGCTDPEKPNFSFQANVDDGTCSHSQTNFTFGGVYQTCTQEGQLHGDYCYSKTQMNTLTQGFSCPSGYLPIPFDSVNEYITEYNRRCHEVWYIFWIGSSCKNEPVRGKIHYKSYWCAATEHIKQGSGYMFGGLFTQKTNNPATGASTCPPNYHSSVISRGVTICLSRDYDSALPYEVPFGGFFGCHTGNPLATSLKQNDLVIEGKQAWPKQCPNGYSRHLVLIANNCEIEYCILTSSFKSKTLAGVRKPPYMPYPRPAKVDIMDVLIDTKSQTWITLPDSEQEASVKELDIETAKMISKTYPVFSNLLDISPAESLMTDNAAAKTSNAKNEPSSLPAGVVAMLVIVITMLCICFVIIGVMIYRNRKQKGRTGESYRLITDS